MAYFGATAASSVSNPPINMYAGLGIGNGSSTLAGNNKAKWMYTSTNLTTDILVANFFTDGFYLGMKPGHMVEGISYTSNGSSGAVVTYMGAIVAVTTAGASLSTGSLMTSTFN